MAEVLLQRTRAPQAEAVFKAFREEYPTPARLVAAGPEACVSITRGLGLHWRGPLLYATAQSLAAAGRPPENYEELLRLPGVGPYAAAAWLSLHRGKRAVIVDSNVARWLARMSGRPYDGETRRKRWLLDLAAALTPARVFRDYNYAVLDFTMNVCTTSNPKCDTCPLSRLCAVGQGLDDRPEPGSLEP